MRTHRQLVCRSGGGWGGQRHNLRRIPDRGSRSDGGQEDEAGRRDAERHTMPLGGALHKCERGLDASIQTVSRRHALGRGELALSG